MTKIKENQAVHKCNSQGKEAEISIVVRSRMLVRVRGAGIDKIDELLPYAKAIDYEALAKYLEKYGG